MVLRPQAKTTPDEWGARNRVYPASAGIPGPRDPTLTPYAVPFGRAVAERRYRKVVQVMAAQSGKTDTLFDIVGQRLDQRPVPILYTGPTKQFLEDQFEPRLMQLLDQAPVLKHKVARGKRMKKLRKLVAGVPLRLAHGGSSAALKSDPFGLCITDEVDELLANVKGQGDPIALIDRRGETYADFVHAIVSTPSAGMIETEIDPVTGLEFWKRAEAEDIGSAIWKLWQAGTRHHWAWPCPHCEDYFIPRFSCLVIPRIDITEPGAKEKRERDPTPTEALSSAHVACPRCGGVITESDKAALNARGVYVAPGQSIDAAGVVHGDPPDSMTLSLWVSGLCSPFSTFGDRAAAYIEAMESGDVEKVQGVKNGAFGELWAPTAGDIPAWEAIASRKGNYAAGTVTPEMIYLTMGIDVQKVSIPFVIRAWGGRATSWLVEHGEIWGRTTDTDVWDQLAEKITAPIGGMKIKLVFIDSGFRPGKRTELPLNRVYEFCRRFRHFVFPTKGSSKPLITPMIKSVVEVTQQGSKDKYGLELIRLDSDHWKSWVHERLMWPLDKPGAWHINRDATEDYFRQLVSEVRVRSPTLAPIWIERGRSHDYLDAEAIAAAAGFMLNVHDLKVGVRREQIAQQQSEGIPRAPAADRGSAVKPGRFGGLASRLNQ